MEISRKHGQLAESKMKVSKLMKTIDIYANGPVLNFETLEDLKQKMLNCDEYALIYMNTKKNLKN